MPGGYTLIGGAGLTGGGSPGVTNFGSLGAGDATSRGTFYFIEDFLKNIALPEVTTQTFGASNTVAPLGVVTTAPNLTNAEFAQHPGLYAITSVNKNSGATGCSNMALGEGSVYGVASGAITYQWSITFKSPAVLSNPTDQYVLAVGTSRTSSSDALNTGMGIRYCDDTNSGMWTLYTVDPQGGYYPINTSTTFLAATWYTLIITASGYAGNGTALFSFNLNGNSLGTYSAANWSTSTLWPLSQGGVSLARKAAGGTPAVITSYLDRCAVYITGLGR